MSHGAKCSPATFEGERCLYGALTNEIKDLLVDASQISAHLMLRLLLMELLPLSNMSFRDEFSEHMRRLFEGSYGDFTIKCLGGSILCHKFILASRSQFFGSKFKSRWENKSSILCKIPLDYMSYLLEYLYTAQCSVPVLGL
jgi:ankyrin repeat/BTB/POZ domain-containing protein 1